MFTISIKSNMAAVLQDIDAASYKIKISAAIALTRTAKSAQVELREEMKRVFDRPTPWALNGTYIKPATVGNLQSEVGIKDKSIGTAIPAINFLHAEIYGGKRSLKGFELAFNGIIPPGMYAVPGSAAKLDAYGNMSKGLINQILSALKLSERTAGHTSNRSKVSARRNKKTAQYFIGRAGGGKLPMGVWQSFRFAHGSAIKPIIIFVKQPHYKIRLNFSQVVDRVVDRDFNSLFAAELRHA